MLTTGGSVMRLLTLILILLLNLSSAFADATILLYHRFGEDRYPSTSVRIDQFEAHLDYLATQQYQVWPLERIVESLKQGRMPPDKTVAITVDDAYLSVYQHAFPRLKALGWPFTVFVSTEPVDQKLNDFMSWEQIREMARNGARFANHGVTHRHLLERLPEEGQSKWRKRMHWEIDRAQQRLEEELGVTDRLFAYPFGEFDQALAEIVVEKGFVGFGQQSGPVGVGADFRALPRFPMSETYATLSEFRQKVQTLAMPLLSVKPWDPLIQERNPPRLELVFAQPLNRASEVRCYVTGQGLAEIEWLDARFKALAVRAKEPLAAGRSRYNCTIPAEGGRYYWYSHPWLVKEE